MTVLPANVEPLKLTLNAPRRTLHIAGQAVNLQGDARLFFIAERLERERLSPQGGGYGWDNRPAATAVCWDDLETVLEQEKLASPLRRKFRTQAVRIGDIFELVGKLDYKLRPHRWRIVTYAFPGSGEGNTRDAQGRIIGHHRLDIRHELVAPNEAPHI